MMKNLVHLAVFLVANQIGLARSEKIFQVTSIEMRPKNRIYVCANAEIKSDLCFLTSFSTIFKPKDFYFLEFTKEKKVLVRSIHSDKTLSLDLYEYKFFDKDPKKPSSVAKKSYLDQHDPRTDYMIF